MKFNLLADKIHARIRSSLLLQLFTAATRLLLSIGFIIPGLQKFREVPFTSMPPSAGVWAEFFHVLYRTGPYYNFIGACQVIAALLLLIPKLAHIGNLIYFPIILNIAVLTNSIFGTLTPLITLLMLLASTWLLCWDYDRLKPLFTASSFGGNRFIQSEWWLLPAAAFLAGVLLVTVASMAKIGPSMSVKGQLTVIMLATISGLVVAVHHRFMD